MSRQGHPNAHDQDADADADAMMLDTPVDNDAPPSALRDAQSDPDPDDRYRDDDDDDAPADLMVVSRQRRSNAGNRMSTLIAKAAEQEEWGEEWEEAPNEEDFVGDDANDQDDFNLDSSSSEDEDAADDEDAGEKELRKAERQERIKKRKPATNPFTARLAAARKKVKLNVPAATESPAPRPKKKSERASWIPTEEDGPIRTSSRRQTVANKESTMAKLKEKDKRRDDTLSMMKAAEARKAKDQPKPLSQAERLAEAARLERLNSKSLHRWEEEEELRAAERQAKIDALKNRQIDGPFIRYYSGPAIWVDDKIKYTGKDAPSLENLEEKLNKDSPIPTTQDTQPAAGDQTAADSTPQSNPIGQEATAGPMSAHIDSQPPPQPQAPQGVPVQDVSASSQSLPYSNNIMFGPPQDPFLFGMEQYAQPQQDHPPPQPQQPFQVSQSELPPNPFIFNSSFPQSQQPEHHPSLQDPIFTSADTTFPPSNLLSQFQNRPPPPPLPPKKKVIQRALRNLLILSSFPNLDSIPPTTSARPAKSTSTLLKEKDRAALIQLTHSLFSWSVPDATTFVSAMLSAPKTKKDKEALARPRKDLCAVSNLEAKYRDPETGIAYRDSRAFGVLRGVVGGGFVWCGEAGCYVGGRAKPMEGMGKGFSGMPPVRGVPKRFLEMGRGGEAAKMVKPVSASAGGRITPSSSKGGVAAPAVAVAAGGGGGGALVQPPVKVEGSVALTPLPPTTATTVTTTASTPVTPATAAK